MTPRLCSVTGVFSWRISSMTAGDVSLSWLMMSLAVVIIAAMICSVASSSCGSVITCTGTDSVAKSTSAHGTNVLKIYKKSYTNGCVGGRGSKLAVVWYTWSPKPAHNCQHCHRSRALTSIMAHHHHQSTGKCVHMSGHWWLQGVL